MIGKNNPFNIRARKFHKWQGSSGSTKGFVNFVELDLGIRAAIIIVMRSYRNNKIWTIQDIIKRFAPPCENDTDAYIKFVVRDTQISPLKELTSQIQYARVLHAMSKFEGNLVTFEKICQVMNMYNLTMSINYEKKDS